jgi:hypothetical protein
MVLQKACAAAIEGFTGGNSGDKKRDAYVEFVSVLLAFVISLVILGFIGKLLWNGVVVELVTIAKPARSFWQIIGLMIMLSLLRP